MGNSQLLIQHDEAQIAVGYLLHQRNTQVIQPFLGGKRLGLGRFHALAGLAPDIKLPGGAQTSGAGNRIRGGGGNGSRICDLGK